TPERVRGNAGVPTLVWVGAPASSVPLALPDTEVVTDGPGTRAVEAREGAALVRADGAGRFVETDTIADVATGATPAHLILQVSVFVALRVYQVSNVGGDSLTTLCVGSPCASRPGHDRSRPGHDPFGRCATKIAVPGKMRPRSGLHWPHTCKCPSGHS